MNGVKTVQSDYSGKHSQNITEMNRAKREQALLAAIVESSDDAIVSISTDSQIMTWNQGAQRLLGFTAHEAIGQTVDLYLAPATRQLAHARIAEDLLLMKKDHQAVRRLETQMQRKCSGLVDVSLVVSGIYDGSGELLGMSSIIRDITERKRAEREQALLAAIVESSDDAIVSISTDSRIMTWNQGAERLFGFTADEAIGQLIDIYLPPAQWVIAHATIVEDLNLMRRDHRFVRRLEVQMQRKDGGLVDVSLVGSGIYDRGGELLGLSSVIRDITELKRAEREQGLLAAIVESSEDAIITAALDRTIRTWNSGAEQLYGYSTQEVVGKPLTMLLPADRRAESEELFGKMILGQTICQYETKRVRKDGTLIDVSLSESPVRDQAGKIVAVAAIGRDISERVRARKLESQTAAIVKSLGRCNLQHRTRPHRGELE
jgi:PAS domain S-box-containing protein